MQFVVRQIARMIKVYHSTVSRAL